MANATITGHNEAQTIGQSLNGKRMRHYWYSRTHAHESNGPFVSYVEINGVLQRFTESTARRVPHAKWNDIVYLGQADSATAIHVPKERNPRAQINWLSGGTEGQAGPNRYIGSLGIAAVDSNDVPQSMSQSFPTLAEICGGLSRCLREVRQRITKHAYDLQN